MLASIYRLRSVLGVRSPRGLSIIGLPSLKRSVVLETPDDARITTRGITIRCGFKSFLAVHHCFADPITTVAS